MKQLIGLFVLVVLMIGCATANFYAQRQLSFISYSKNIYPPHEKDYPIDLFFQDKPQRQYEVIGEVMGYVIHDRNFRPILEIRARQVGADGVIDITTSMGVMNETGISQQSVKDSSGSVVGTMPVATTSSQKVINIKAKMIKYKQ